MQRDIVSVAADMLHGGEDCGGAVTSGGTESIFMAVKTARDKARAEAASAAAASSCPKTAHPAFRRRCHLLDVEFVQMPLGDDSATTRVDLATLLTDDTMLAVGRRAGVSVRDDRSDPEMAAVAVRARHPVPRRCLPRRVHAAVP